VIVQCDSQRIFFVNAVASRLWELLVEPRTRNELAYAVHREYGVPLATAREDVQSFLDDLAAANLLVGGAAEASTPVARSVHHDDPTAWSRLRETAERCLTPLHAVVEVTQACNLSCRHCYNGGPPAKPLSAEEMHTLLGDLVSLGSLYLTVTGGEPLVHGRFFEILKDARNLGFAITLKSNGTLLTGAVIDLLRELAVMDVHLSLYSTVPGEHDDITGQPGSCAKTVAAARALAAKGFRVRLSCPLMRTTWRSANRVADLAAEIGATTGFDLLITARTDGSREPLCLRMAERDLAAFLADPGALGALLSGPTRGEYDAGRAALPDDPEATLCAAGRSVVAISACGDVYPCIVWPCAVGNIREPGGFPVVWKSSARLREARGCRVRDYRSCRGCKVVASCPRCPGFFFTESRDPLQVSPVVCRVAKLLDDVAGRPREQARTPAIGGGLRRIHP
jgi:radical SAM protein with 4Fe4S-binding SPASM domain